jgi:hypothetical protein
VDFSYLVEKAAVESGFQTDVKAQTSSATGLYQFIDSTWLNVVKEHGATHGLGEFAAEIETRADGTPYVSDPSMRRKILDLRKDPEVSAAMVAEFTRDNMEHLKKTVGGKVGSTELYLAHFLGAQGASKFLLAMRENPSQPAHDLFPNAALANQSIFYQKSTNRPTTLGEIYDRFAGKFSESEMNEVITSRSRGEGETYVAPANGLGDPIMASPISRYASLALAALEVPNEVHENGKTAFGSRQINPRGYRAYARNEFRNQWHDEGEDT